jgi:restriction system protein
MSNSPESNIPIPPYTAMLLPTLTALQSLGGSATKDELDEAVVQQMGISEEQVAVEFPEEARQRGSKVLHRFGWVRTYLKKMELIENSARAVWGLLPAANEYLLDDPEAANIRLVEFDRNLRKQARLLQVEPNGSAGDGDAENEDLDPLWETALLERMLGMEPDAFERLAQRLLREAGFTKVQVLGKTGDGGIDGVGILRVSLVSFPVFFQCKRYKGSVGSGAVRDFRGAMSGRGEKGLLITTGTFTSEAVREASRDGAPPVELVDGDELCQLLKEYSLGVVTTERIVQDVAVDLSYFDSI